MGWHYRRGRSAKECIVADWQPYLARPRPREPVGDWRSDCPVCRADRAVSVALGAKGRRPVWCRFCDCDPVAVGAAIAARVACYHHGRTRRALLTS
jgi:hypothetical protein